MYARRNARVNDERPIGQRASRARSLTAVAGARARHPAPAVCEHAVVQELIEEAPAPARAARRALRPRRLGVAGDRAWAGALLVLPLVVFALPALAGHPVLLGDDLTQNEPLRALVGIDLRHGQLPLLDPYLWSGAPLLGGWNAGAAYPLTWCFAVLSPVAAWSANLVVTWWVASISFYALLRAARLQPAAAGAGALSFAFGGAFLAQVVHLGLVEGMSWVPLQALAVTRLTACAARAPARWVAVLGAGLGATVLAGEPRAIDDALVVVACVATWRLVRLGRRRLVAAGRVAAGLVLGGALGAVQLLPGLGAVAGSQRAGASLSLFASGSLPDRWLGLLLVPDLLGGSGSFGLPAFLGGYNLTEVSGYAGALALVGAVALLARLQRGGGIPDWLVWHLVTLVGVVLALGVNTPVGHLLARLPFYGAQRLQSRNLVVADVGLCALLGHYLEGLLAESRLAGRRSAPRWPIAAGVVALVLPGALVAGFGAAALRRLLGGPVPAAQAAALVPELVPFLVLAGLAGLVALGAARLAVPARRRVLVGFVALNLAVAAAFTVVAVPPVGSPGRRPAPARPRIARPAAPTGPVRTVASLGLAGGRFAVYDPDLLDASQLSALGAPDRNVVLRAPSVLGYGSIVEGRYAAATGAHTPTGQGQDRFAPAAAADGVLDRLATTVLLTPPSYLVTPASGGGPAAGRGTGRRSVAPGHAAAWSFGSTLALDRLAIAVRGPGAGAPARIGLVEASGRTRWLDRVHAARAGGPRGGPDTLSWAAGVAGPLRGVGLRVLAGAEPLRLGPPQLRTAAGSVLVMDGQLAAAAVPPRWRYAGHDGGFAVFRDRFAQPVLHLKAAPGRPLRAASVRALGGPRSAPAAARVSSASGAVVVRAVTDLPGWTASFQPTGSPQPVPLRLRRDGLVQAVTVPPGTGVLRWRYDPPGFVPGAALSLAGLAVLACLLAVDRRSARAQPT